MVRKAWLEWIGMLLICMIPLLWFRHGNFLASLDTLLPQTWEDNLRLLHIWNHQLETGTFFFFDGAAFLFNLIPAVVLELGAGMKTAQQVEFLFWFSLTALGMHRMMRRIYAGPHPRMARLIAALFYSTNFYVGPIWMGFNKPNIALYALLPWILSLLLPVLSGETKRWPTLGWIALLTLGAAAMGTNTPIVMVAGLAVGLIFLAMAALALRGRRWTLLWTQISAIIVLLALAALLHAFWLWPQFRIALQEAAGSPLQQAREQALAFVEGLSRNTSFWNVIRFQGDWTWYTGHGEPYVLFAFSYLNNPFWIILSWMVPTFTLIGILRSRNQYRTVFLSFWVVGVLLSMGTYPPTGFLFRWLMTHLPGGWMFRSAWFKFMILTSVGAAFFIASGVAGCLDRLKSPSAKKWGILAAIGCLVLYHHPVITGEIFPRAEQRKSLPPLQFKIPSYVNEAADWFQRQPADERVFFMPGKTLWANQWGYPGLMPFLGYKIRQPLLYDMDPVYQMVSQGAGHPSLFITRMVWKSLNPYRGDLSPRLDRLLRLLGVSAVLHETDYRYDLLPLVDRPERIRSKLAEQRGLHYQRAFGPWELYSVEHPQPLWSLSNGVCLTWGDPNKLDLLSRTEVLDSFPLVFARQNEPEIRRLLFQKNLVKKQLFIGDKDIGDGMENAPENSIPSVSIAFSESVDKSGVGTVLKAPPAQPFISHRIEWSWGQGTAVSESGKGHRILNNAEPDLILNNPWSFPVTIHLSCSILAPATARMLYPTINATLFSLDTAGTRTTVLIPPDATGFLWMDSVRLLPGLNRFDFGTTEPWIKQDGIERSFVVDEIKLGDLKISAPIYLPSSGNYRPRLYPKYQGALSAIEAETFETKEFEINEEKIFLAAHQDDQGLWYWEGNPVALKSGSALVTAETFFGDDWVAELSSIPANDAPGIGRKIQPTDTRPTAYALDFQLTQPGVLMFNESVHPGWDAHGWPHFCVNGFANAWIAPEGTHFVRVFFRPQEWTRQGQKISIGTGLFLLIALGIQILVRKVRRRRT